MDEEVLYGGVANAGAVIRVGDEVRRPTSPFTRSVFALLEALGAGGFEGVQVPRGLDEAGRERLTYLTGDVPLPPYPEWAQSDEALVSIVTLMQRFHTATRAFEADGFTWNDELADPEGGPVVCHNDVCLENVVFRDGEAVGLIDFDFAAPGRPVHDLAQFAKMCVPMEEDTNATRLGWTSADRPARLRLVADSYGLDTDDRALFFTLIDREMQTSGDFVRRRAEAGDPGFVQMWTDQGGAEFYERRKRWWSASHNAFASGLR